MKDNQRLADLQLKQEQEWENTCLNCGACCGAADGDPCENLEFIDGKSRCIDYENRFGIHHTKNGREFKCVPIRNIISKSWSGDKKCAYKKMVKDNYIKELINECSDNRGI